MAKRALLCGCNYPGTKSKLNGCINDCISMHSLLTEHFGFRESDITMMLDTDPSTTQPTGANIKARLQELADASRSGDVLFFHFSGHGTQVPDDDESDGYDEAICPTDMNVICDDDLRAIFCHLAPGVKLTMIADCCHSGTLLDHSSVAITGPKAGEAVPDLSMQSLSGLLGGLLLGGRGSHGGGGGDREIRNRALPTNTFLDLLSSQLGGASVGKGNIRNSLVALFGQSSSKKAISYGDLAKQAQAALAGAKKGDYTQVMPLMSSMFSKFGKGGGGSGGGGNTSHTPAGAAAGKGSEARLGEDVGILITGCQAHETSADACPGGSPAQAYGALSNGLSTVLRAHFQQNPGTPISSRTLVTGVREALAKAGYAQNPCLECSHANADTHFILH